LGREYNKEYQLFTNSERTYYNFNILLETLSVNSRYYCSVKT